MLPAKEKEWEGSNRTRCRARLRLHFNFLKEIDGTLSLGCSTDQANIIATTKEPSLKSDVSAISKGTIYCRLFMSQVLCQELYTRYLILAMSLWSMIFYTHLINKNTGTTQRFSETWPQHISSWNSSSSPSDPKAWPLNLYILVILDHNCYIQVGWRSLIFILNCSKLYILLRHREI